MDCSNYKSPVPNDILYINFNQDCSCLSVGTKTGFRLYNCENFGKFYENNICGAGICQMMFSSSLVAIAGSGDGQSPRKVLITNSKRETIICELNFMSKVLDLHVNRKRLAVVLEDRIHLYDIATMKLLHTIDTPTNASGVSALSPDAEKGCFLAYPSNSNTGEITVFDCIQLRPLNIIKAHKTPVTRMTFNQTGEYLATASDKGTIIRVFKVATTEKLYQFRRGSLPANIHYLCFDESASMLAVTSDTDTIHIFKLTPTSTSFFGSLLPESMSESWESTRDFAHIRHPKPGAPSICAFLNNSKVVVVVTAEGMVYYYNLNTSDGTVQFSHQQSLSASEQNPMAQSSTSDVIS